MCGKSLVTFCRGRQNDPKTNRRPRLPPPIAFPHTHFVEPDTHTIFVGARRVAVPDFSACSGILVINVLPHGLCLPFTTTKGCGGCGLLHTTLSTLSTQLTPS